MSPEGGTTAPGSTPASLAPGSGRFWLAVVATGVATGLAGAALMRLLQAVQHAVWPGQGLTLAQAASRASPAVHVGALLAAALLVGAAGSVLTRLPRGEASDVPEAITFAAGRVARLRTLGSALLSIVVVGMGVSLGREAAPKEAGAVFANVASDRARLTDDERRVLVACGAGAGMSAAYGVPLGGALFAVEVLLGAVSLPLVLPALVTSIVATGVSWLFLPDAPTYVTHPSASPASALGWALVTGPAAGVVSAGYVRAVAWAHDRRPEGWRRLAAPALVLGALGLVSIRYPQLLGNGKDIVALALSNDLTVPLLVALLFLKPAATVLCLASGARGGLFTPSLALGALLGATIGRAWSSVWPGLPPELFAFAGGAAVVAGTTQGPLSATVLVLELTGRERSFLLPLLVTVSLATLVSRTIDPRSVYDARLSPEQTRARRRAMDAPPASVSPPS